MTLTQFATYEITLLISRAAKVMVMTSRLIGRTSLTGAAASEAFQ